MTYLFTQLEYLLRILGAVLCGFVVGFERENHYKTAGIRTHTIVALASALMMIVSKYGFFDVLSMKNIGLDPSRIAAGVVTAIGFLGAGIIFTRNMNVSGLTTAAGIWATVGIGMTFGAGMYILGVFSTALMVLLQYLLHRNLRIFKSPTIQQITIRMDVREDMKEVLEDTFSIHKLKIISMKVIRVDDTSLKVKLNVVFPDDYSYSDVIDLIRKNPKIQSIDI